MALGFTRYVPLPRSTSEEGQQTLPPDQITSEQSNDQLAETIRTLVNLRESVNALEAWWNTFVWGAIYVRVKLNHPDLKMECVERPKAHQHRGLD